MAKPKEIIDYSGIDIEPVCQGIFYVALDTEERHKTKTITVEKKETSFFSSNFVLKRKQVEIPLTATALTHIQFLREDDKCIRMFSSAFTVAEQEEQGRHYGEIICLQRKRQEMENDALLHGELISLFRTKEYRELQRYTKELEAVLAYHVYTTLQTRTFENATEVQEIIEQKNQIARLAWLVLDLAYPKQKFSDTLDSLKRSVSTASNALLGTDLPVSTKISVDEACQKVAQIEASYQAIADSFPKVETKHSVKKGLLCFFGCHGDIRCGYGHRCCCFIWYYEYFFINARLWDYWLRVWV